MNREGLANAVYVSESLVRAWERGRRLPKPDTLKIVEKALGIGDGETPGYLSRFRDEMINEAVPLEWFGRWQEIERQADELWWFEVFFVPGLLQTEEYATEILRAGSHNADLDELVAARLDRQEILTRDENPPMLIAVIGEVALRSNVGGHKVMYDQLMHLVDMAHRENVIVQVIPLDSPSCAAFVGHFVVAKFDSEGDVAYLDNAIRGETAEDPEVISRLRKTFNRFRASALPEVESIELIKKIAEELWKE